MNKFKVFNSVNDSKYKETLSDSDYQTVASRGILVQEVAASDVYNKLFRQLSLVASAIGDIVVNSGLLKKYGTNFSDDELTEEQVKELIIMALTGSENDRGFVSVMTPATTTEAGNRGLVPGSPVKSSEDDVKYLTNNGKFEELPETPVYKPVSSEYPLGQAGVIEPPAVTNATNSEREEAEKDNRLVKFLSATGEFKVPGYYTHPTGAGYHHIPAGGSTGMVIASDSTGNPVWEDKFPKGANNQTLKMVNNKPQWSDLFPVGSIQIFQNNTNPNKIYPGVWEKIAPGKVLLGSSASYPLGTTGGTDSIALTVENLPSHKHDVEVTVERDGLHSHRFSASITYEDAANGLADRGAKPRYSTTEQEGEHSHQTTVTEESVGNNEPFSILPPYLVVNIWARVS